MKPKQFKALIPEREHLNACLELCRRLCIVAWRNNTGGATYKRGSGEENKGSYVRFGFKGAPDIIGYVPALNEQNKSKFIFAVPFFWEVKRQGGRATKEQKAFIETAQKNRCIAGIGTVDDLEKELKRWRLLT